jgi:hypothetical protein
MGRRDVQGFAAAQLHARANEVQLYAPAIGVRVAHPSNIILLPIQPREGQRLEHGHGLGLLFRGGGVFGGKAQNAMRVAPLAANAVDEIAGAVHVTTHHLRRRMASAFLAG